LESKGIKEANPDAYAILEANEGYYFGNQVTGLLVCPSTLKGMHGYSPEESDMRPGFVASGKGVSSGEILGEANLVDVAPTVAKLLNLDLPDTDGTVIKKVLK